jgi:hypothetical protein
MKASAERTKMKRQTKEAHDSNFVRPQRTEGEGIVSHQYGNHEPAIIMHENITSLFQPDTVLAAQYFDNLRRKMLLEPEKELLLAVLEDGIKCFQDNILAKSGKAKKLFDETEEWVLERDRDWVFSFENICEVLGFDPRYVRQGLLRWKHQQLKRHAQTHVRETRETPRYAVIGK